MKRTVLILVLPLLTLIPACEILDQIQGVATLMEQASEHFEEDIKAELTDAKIDLFVRVTPALKKFSDEAKVKWTPDPKANDFSQLSTQLGALGDYVAFFDSQDTRLTEYWAVMIKVYDAYAVVAFDEGQTKALKILADERAELETKKAAASGEEVAKIEQELKRNDEALKNLDKIKEARAKGGPDGKQNKPYTLSDAEIDRVRARKAEIEGVMKDAGYMKDTDAAPAEAEK